MAELKKCPFCGSDAEVHQNQAGMFVVRCIKFGCWVSTMPCDFEETAIIKWNTRPTATETEIRAKAISDYLQFVYDNASNEEYANEDGWAMSDLIDLEFKYLEQLKERE